MSTGLELGTKGGLSNSCLLSERRKYFSQLRFLFMEKSGALPMNVVLFFCEILATRALVVKHCSSEPEI